MWGPFRRKGRSEPADPDKCENEERLSRAEARANNVFEKALALHTIVTRRDQANHWQESVNRLFSGGNP
jgi:hypothetical protein